MLPLVKTSKGPVVSGKLANEELLNRIKKLGIPPAWTDVKISRDPNSFLQITGKDANGKTQYIYHPIFVGLTTVEKFNRLKKFCKKIDSFILFINSRINSRNNSIDDREYLLCLMFNIMFKTYLRVGNYGQNTYGLSTLEKRHIKFPGRNVVIFDFIGKKGIRNHKTITDAGIYHDLESLTKNKTKFQRVFIDKQGHAITSQDMNDYLRKHMGSEFTCKDFRTYASNILFIKGLIGSQDQKSLTGSKDSKDQKSLAGQKDSKDSKKLIKEVYDSVAKELCHTKNVSKKSYVNSKIEEYYLNNPQVFRIGREPGEILLKILD
jgi:DNA topoisomerase-1